MAFSSCRFVLAKVRRSTSAVDESPLVAKVKGRTYLAPAREA